MRIKFSWVALSVVVLSVGLLLVASLDDSLFNKGRTQCHFPFAARSVPFLKDSTPPRILQALSTRRGAELLSAGDFSLGSGP